MRFTNEETLRTLLKAAKYGIASELPATPTSQVALGTIVYGLEELLKRETVQQELFAKLHPEGTDLVARQIDFLAGLNVAGIGDLKARREEIVKLEPAADSVSANYNKYEALAVLMEDCCRILFSEREHASRDQRATMSALMKESADWEMRFHELNQAPPEEEAAQLVESTLAASDVEAFIARQSPEGKAMSVQNIKRVLGGFGKETWLFDLVNADNSEAMVLRRNKQAPGSLDRGSWQIDREFEIVQMVHEQGIIVPAPLWLGCNEPNFDDDFYVCRRVAGGPMGTFMKGNDDLNETIWFQVAEQLARLHTIPIEYFDDYIRKNEGESLVGCTAGQGMKHYLDWWYNWWKEFDRESSPLEIYLFDWLYSHVPDDPRPASLIHSDFGPHNMMYDNNQLTAILDWEAVLFGSPAIDLAYVKRWVTETMEWSRFVDHYEASGGPRIDPSEYAYCNALMYTRTLTATRQSVASVRYHNSTEFKEYLLDTQFAPTMMRMAYDSTI